MISEDKLLEYLNDKVEQYKKIKNTGGNSRKYICDGVIDTCKVLILNIEKGLFKEE